MRTIQYSLILLGLVFSLHLYAGENLTLHEAMTLIQHSLRFEKNQIKENIASIKKEEKKSLFLPELSFKAIHYEKQTMIPNLLPTTLYAINLNWNLFDGGSSLSNFKSADLQLKASAMEKDWSYFAQKREVALAFYRALCLDELKKVAEKNVQALTDHVREMALYKKEGTATKFDLLKGEVLKSEAETEFLNASDNAAFAIIHLGELLGIKNETRLLEGALPDIDSSLSDKIKNLKSDDERLDLMALKERIQAIQLLQEVEKQNYLPKVSFISDFQEYNNHNKNLTGANDFRNAYSVGLMMSWIFFDGFKGSYKSAALFEEKVLTEKNLREAEIKASNDQIYWVKKFVFYQRAFLARVNDVEKSNENVRLAQVGRKVGTRTNTDLLDAQNEFTKAMALKLNAQMGMIESILNLELITGKKLWEGVDHE